MKFNVHGGHNRIVQGASKFLNEVVEDRKVKDEVIRLLKSKNHIVHDCTDDVGKTQNDNLKNIVKKCNANTVDLDISIHLNIGRSDSVGDGKTGGVEVWCYDKGTKEYAERICKKISNGLGVTNRGVKYSKDFYVLKNTKAPALLIECCFVDDKDDYKKWNANKCAKAIVEGILNKTVTENTQSNSTSNTAKFLIKIDNVKKGDTLNIREKPDPSSKIVKKLKYDDPNKYTIIETKKNGTETWGKLKSGIGWINLRYTKKV